MDVGAIKNTDAGIRSMGCAKVKIDNNVKQARAEDGFIPGEQVDDSSSRMEELAGKSAKKSWRSGQNKAEVFAKSVVSGLAGVIGGVVGLAIGLAYDATVVVPFIGAGTYTDAHYGVTYFDSLVRQFSSPVTLAVRGTKHGYRAAVRAWES